MNGGKSSQTYWKATSIPAVSTYHPWYNSFQNNCSIDFFCDLTDDFNNEVTLLQKGKNPCWHCDFQFDFAANYVPFWWSKNVRIIVNVNHHGDWVRMVWSSSWRKTWSVHLLPDTWSLSKFSSLRQRICSCQGTTFFSSVAHNSSTSLSMLHCPQKHLWSWKWWTVLFTPQVRDKFVHTPVPRKETKTNSLRETWDKKLLARAQFRKIGRFRRGTFCHE